MGYEKRLEQLIEAAKDGRVVGHGVQAEIIEDPNGLHYGDKQTFSFTIVKKNADYRPKGIVIKEHFDSKLAADPTERILSWKDYPNGFSS